MKSGYTNLIIFLGLFIANMMGCIDLTMVSSALTSIQASLNLDDSHLQWIPNALYLTLSAFMVVSGNISDKYGKVPVLYIGLILLGISSFFAGVSQSFLQLIFCRVLQGISIAILYTVPPALVSQIFTKKTGTAMGILFCGSGIGLAAGPAIGSLLVDLFGWRSIFFVNLPIAIAAFLCCIFSTKLIKKQINTSTIDWLGMIMLIFMLPSFIFASINAAKFGFIRLDTLLLYTLSIILFVIFYKHEKKFKSPIIGFELFKNKIFIVGIIANFFLAFYYASDLFVIPLHLHDIEYFSNGHIGLILLIPTIMVAIISPFAGVLCDKFNPRKVLSFGYIFLIISAFLQLHIHYLIFNEHATWIPYILFGIGWALILSPSLVTAISALPSDMSGVAMGTVGTLHNFGGAIGLAITSNMYYKNSILTIFCTSIIAFIFIIITIFKKGNYNVK